jgi:hypothetical protein
MVDAFGDRAGALRDAARETVSDIAEEVAGLSATLSMPTP